jgi:hypothetical protein
MAMLRQLSRLDICLGIAQDDSEREYASNPVKRGLVEQPDQWKWRSFRAYLFGERGPVRVNFQEWKSEIKKRPPQKFGRAGVDTHPLIRKEREWGAPG